MARKRITREEILEVYVTKGATPAAELAKVSRRTVQRWANEEGLSSGFSPEDRITQFCPSAASYARGCRCDGCRKANRERAQMVKASRVKRVRQGNVKAPHGVSGYSNWDCRCPKCRKAWSEYLRERRVIRAAERAAEAERVAKEEAAEQRRTKRERRAS